MLFWRDGHGIQGQNYVPRLPENEISAGYDTLDTIIALGMSFLCTYLLYIYIYMEGDVIFNQAYNRSFHESLESLQYHASLAITRAIRQ